MATRRNSFRMFSQKTTTLVILTIVGCFIFVQQDPFNIFQTPTIPPPVMDIQEGEWTCRGEKMNFPSYNGSSVWNRGLPFNCSLLEYLREFKLTSQEKISPTPRIEASEVSFVTYSSSNHFLESREGIRRLRNILPNRIIYYDLGLTEEETADIKTVCNLEYRKFNFEKYPDFVRDLMTYSFKPIIMAEVFAQEPVFWTFDASVRFNSCIALEQLYDEVNNEKLDTFLMEKVTGHSIHTATHYGTYTYLPILPELTHGQMFQALSIFIVRSDFSREILKWNLLCALTEDCIAPAGSSIYCKMESVQGPKHRTTNECHRFDQSALSIIVTSLREGRGLARRQFTQVGGAFDGVITIERESTYEGPLPVKCR